MIALPNHSPCGIDGCGEIEHGTLSVQCTTRRSFVIGGGHLAPVDARGCGKISRVCAACGLRAKWDDGRCGACERTEP